MNKLQILLILMSSSLIIGGKVTPCLERPCPDLDVDCIRKYFECTGSCCKPEREVPQPLIRPYLEISVPCINVTATRTNTEVLGFDWEITEFYVNPDTNRAVLGVKITDLVLNIPKLHVKYWLPDREPEEVFSSAKEYFSSFTITTVFENSGTLALEESTTSAFFDDIPCVILGPEIHNDKGLKKPLKKYYEYMKFAVGEEFSGPLPDFAAVFIQYFICDYGIEEFY